MYGVIRKVTGKFSACRNYDGITFKDTLLPVLVRKGVLDRGDTVVLFPAPNKVWHNRAYAGRVYSLNECGLNEDIPYRDGTITDITLEDMEG